MKEDAEKNLVILDLIVADGRHIVPCNAEPTDVAPPGTDNV